MKQKHTPGPWAENEHANRDGLIEVGPVNITGPVAKVYRREDALLIAAAPDLLTAVKGSLMFFELFEQSAFKSILDEKEFFPLVTKVRNCRKILTAIIAKAEGRS